MPIVLFLALFIADSALATGLANRFQMVSTESMPKDVWTYGVNISSGLGTQTSTYNSSGRLVTNNQYFSKDLSYAQLLEQTSDQLERELARAAFEVYGKELESNAGTVSNNINIDSSAQTYLLGKGLSDKSDFFIIVPVVTINTEFDSSFQASESLNSLIKTLKNEGQHLRAEEIQAKTQNALYQKLSDYGYETDYPGEITTLANIFLNYRYQALSDKKFSVLSDSYFIIPAGETFDEDDFVDLKINEEQYSLKQGVSVSTQLDRWLLAGGTYYHKRFPFKKKKRVPNSDIDPLSEDIEKLDVKYGDTYGFATQFNYLFTDAKLYLGANLEYKNKDNYDGSRYSQKRYSYLETDSQQRLETAFVGVSYNTINDFLKNQFLIPLDFNLQYGRTIGGENVFYSEQLALNIIGFYK